MSNAAPKFTAFNFDATQHTPQAVPGDTLPAGWYGIIISDAEVKATKSGGQDTRVQLTHTVIAGPYAGRSFIDGQNVVNKSAKAQQIGLGFMSALCQAVGVSGIQDLTQLLNRPLAVSVREVPAEGQYDAKNEVRGYKAWDVEKLGPIPAGNWAAAGPVVNAGLPTAAPAGLPPAAAPAAPGAPAPFTPPPAVVPGGQPWLGGAPGAPAPAAPAPFAPPPQPVPAPGEAPAPFVPPGAAPAPAGPPPAQFAAPFPPATHVPYEGYPGYYRSLADGSAITEQDLRALVASAPPNTAGVAPFAPPAGGFVPPAAPGAPAPFTPPVGQPPAPGSPAPWGNPPGA